MKPALTTTAPAPRADSGPRPRADLRLGFVTGRPVFVEGDTVWTDAGVGRLVEALRDRCQHVTFAASRSPVRRPVDDHRLGLRDMDLLFLPHMPTTAGSAHRHLPCARALRAIDERCDAAVIQLPFQAVTALLHARRPRVYQICADVHALVRGAGHGGLAGKLRGAAADTFGALQQLAVRTQRARVLAHGDELLRQFGKNRGRAIVSSSLYDRELASVPRTRPEGAPFRVLYVGFLRRAKGIDTLLRAFEAFLKRRPDAELHVVGVYGTDDSSGAEIEASVRRLESSGSVRFLGHRAFGPELFSCYANADVLVLPSLSEGTPRVLIEARALGCPVIATRVGGIPSSIDHGVDGWLVPPADAKALCDALLTLSEDTALRLDLVRRGLLRVREYTVEATASLMISEVLALLREARVSRTTSGRKD
jgi:glycosyltransferase involved in cell wall biosynthesis